MKYCFFILFSTVLSGILSGCASSEKAGADSPGGVTASIRFSKQQLARTVAAFGDTVLYPRSTGEDGRWKTVPPRDWTSGFFPGSLWYIYSLTADESFRKSAERWTAGLREMQNLTQTHDVGFIIFDSFGNGYKIDSNETYLPVILQAARSLMSRYNPIVGSIKSWDGRKWPYPVIIDNMMNLELLFWASKHGGTDEMYDAALSHARKTMENHFRADGSTYHVVGYDSGTGTVNARETHQGYADESVWARGQAWALYGFTMAYRETNEEDFLKTAMRAADWFIDHLPDDFVPYWDFLAPGIPREEKDVSAAAIAASGLLELSTFVEDSSLSKKYWNSAVEILGSVSSPAYLAVGTGSYGIVRHAVGNHPKDLEIDVSLIYADYYFLEALSRYTKLTELNNYPSFFKRIP